jgi:transcriptional regulator with XRE-family HTH domain
MTLVTGAQLRAARALAGLDQARLATVAGVGSNTIYRLEKQRGLFEGVKVDTVRRLQLALEAAGIVFTEHGVEAGPKLQRRPTA